MNVSIVMPCLNEARTLPACIARAQDLLRDHGIDGEIIISDNGSTDGSQAIAQKLGARVVDCTTRGYGAALQLGIEQARHDYVLIGDSDDSYHFDGAFPMLQKLEEGYDVCMGTRLRGNIMPGAMPFLNRALGNPLLTFIGRLLFSTDTSDFHCGMRAFRRDKILSLGLVTTGMEWASEQVIKSQLSGLRMTEVPITLHRDGRGRPPHLRRWRDGWRHLRFMLLHAPTWLFLYPGAALVLVALVLGVMLLRGVVHVGAANLDVHSLLTMSFMSIVGIQAIFAGLFANLYAHVVGILPVSPTFIRRLKMFSLEKLLVVFLLMGLAGVLLFLNTFLSWAADGFNEREVRSTMRQLIPALTLLTIALQGIFNCFMFSMLFLKTRGPRDQAFKDELE